MKLTNAFECWWKLGFHSSNLDTEEKAIKVWIEQVPTQRKQAWGFYYQAYKKVGSPELPLTQQQVQAIQEYYHALKALHKNKTEASVKQKKLRVLNT